MNIRDCIPTDKFDLAAVGRAKAVGFPRLNLVLGELLEWTKDFNWPVAEALPSVFADADSEIVTHLRSAFRTHDSVWKYWLLCKVCPKLRPTVLEALLPDLRWLAASAAIEDTAEEVQTEAAKLIARIDGV